MSEEDQYWIMWGLFTIAMIPVGYFIGGLLARLTI